MMFQDSPTEPQHWGTHQKRELACLARNIYFESRGEPFHGQVAVAQVTLNRVRHEAQFGNTICSVVYEAKQFSWTSEKVSVKDRKAWEDAMLIARATMAGTLKLPNFNALYFHTKQVRPQWRKSKKIVRVIGNHIFYS